MRRMKNNDSILISAIMEILESKLQEIQAAQQRQQMPMTKSWSLISVSVCREIKVPSSPTPFLSPYAFVLDKNLKK